GGFKISNGGSSAAKVTSIKFKRTGVSSDSTLNNVYLYDSMGNRLTDAASIANGVISFTDSAGLVSVPSMGSVVVLLRADIAGTWSGGVCSANCTNGQTVGVMTTEVTTDAGAATGLPISGPEHTIAAQPSGIATVQLNGVTPTDNSGIEPQNDFVVWQSTVNIGSRDTSMSAIRFQQIGSAYPDDLQNFRLMVDGVQVGTAVAKADASRFVSFGFATPVTLKAGSHVIKLVGDVVGGSTRTFKFSLRRVVDMEVWDSQLNIAVTPTVTGTDGDSATMTNFPANAGDITVSGGTITITKATDSASGNVVKGGSSITLAKFKVKAQGEKLKVENLKVELTHSIEGTTVASQVGSIRNGALFLDGVQIGSTQNITTAAAGTQFNLGSSMILDVGKEYALEVRGDVFDADGTDNMDNGQTMTVNLLAGSSNVYKMTSLGYLDSSTVSGNQITVATGNLTLSKYSAYSNQTIVVPQTAFKIADFRLSTGATESVNINNITVALPAAYTSTNMTPAHLQDLYVVYGTKTTNTKATGATSQSWSVNETLAANSTMEVRVYATLNSSIANASTTVATVTVDGNSLNSGSAVTSGAIAGQTITAGVGSITSAVDASTPVSANAVANSMPLVASFKFTAVNDNFTITELTSKVTSANDAAAISELVYKVGGTEVRRQPLNGIYSTSTGLAISVPSSGTGVKVVDVYANLGSIGPNAATTSANIAVTLDGFEYQNSNGVKTRDYTDRAGNAMYAFRTKPTITNAALPTPVLADGTQTLAKFQISADTAGSVAWKTIKFTVSNSGAATVTPTTWKLYDNDNQSSVLATGAQSGQVVTFTLTTDQEVSGTKTYVVKGDVTGSAANTSVSMKVNTGVGSRTAPDIQASVAAAATFVWSDMSSQNHSATTPDWMDDYLVKNLPTDAQTMTR
ncbi:MAG TPA: hypothetical protein VLB83_01920, partial [Candidatus Paceibacterota bacterium]|nr:hypothetical protein [Candidatus Paceibacterota bacterium]